METVILRKERASRRTTEGILQKMERKDARIVRCHRENDNTDILIRWGCTGIYGHNFEINTPEMIHLASDKIATRRALIEKGIPVPKTFFTRQEALNFNHFPIIGRRRHHQEGREMTIAHNVQELGADRRSEYWSEFIPKDREYRVYVFFGRVLAFSEKIPEHPERVAWNKSLGNGVFVNLKIQDAPRKIGFLALQAAAALGTDFSAVDIISKGDKAYVLEFNNSPECSPFRQLLFARAFNWVIRRIEQTGKKPEHFQLPRNEQGKMVLLCRD